MSGLFRLIFYGLIVYLITVIIRFFKAVGRAQRRQSPPRPKHSGLMVKDEVCNTYLPREEALRLREGETEHFFCSEDCRRKHLETGGKS